LRGFSFSPSIRSWTLAYTSALTPAGATGEMACDAGRAVGAPYTAVCGSRREAGTAAAECQAPFRSERTQRRSRRVAELARADAA